VLTTFNIITYGGSWDLVRGPLNKPVADTGLEFILGKVADTRRGRNTVEQVSNDFRAGGEEMTATI
jgi:hypothetical protein